VPVQADGSGDAGGEVLEVRVQADVRGRAGGGGGALPCGVVQAVRQVQEDLPLLPAGGGGQDQPDVSGYPAAAAAWAGSKPAAWR
jgi:hypothetical protein